MSCSPWESLVFFLIIREGCAPGASDCTKRRGGGGGTNDRGLNWTLLLQRWECPFPSQSDWAAQLLTFESFQGNILFRAGGWRGEGIALEYACHFWCNGAGEWRRGRVQWKREREEERGWVHETGKGQGRVSESKRQRRKGKGKGREVWTAYLMPGPAGIYKLQLDFQHFTCTSKPNIQFG